VTFPTQQNPSRCARPSAASESGDLPGIPLSGGLSASTNQCTNCRPGDMGGAGLAHGLNEVALGLRTLDHRRAQRRDRRGVEFVVGVRFVVLEPGGELIGVLQDLFNASWHQGSPQELLPGRHRVDDDDRCLTMDVAHLQDDRGGVRADHHGEPVAEVPDPNRVALSVEDLVLVESVLESGLGDDRIVHNTKLTCGMVGRQRRRRARSANSRRCGTPPRKTRTLHGSAPPHTSAHW